MLSIIVPARNDAAWTERCLHSAFYSIGKLGIACEFILIDDNSEPAEGIGAIFRNFRDTAMGIPVTILRSRKHQHYTGVFSLGLHFAKGDPILFLSNDMAITPAFIATQMAVMAIDPAFGIVRGTANNVDSHPEHQVAPPPLTSYESVEAFSRQRAQALGTAWVEDEFLSGDAVLIRRAVIDRIGVLDLRFFGYFSDVDYGLRAQLAGFKLVCAKGAWLFHEGAVHLKREMAAKNKSGEEMMSKRMALVDAAYRVFREKWGIGASVPYNREMSLAMLDAAKRNATGVDLTYRLPPETLTDIEHI